METTQRGPWVRMQDALQAIILLAAIVASYMATVQRIAVLETKVDILMRSASQSGGR